MFSLLRQMLEAALSRFSLGAVLVAVLATILVPVLLSYNAGQLLGAALILRAIKDYNGFHMHIICNIYTQ